jgi:type VI secretion system protein ImpH
MADDHGRAPDPLALERLAADQYALDYFQALRRIECSFRDQPRLGTADRPTQEPVRVGQEVGLEFAPSAVASFVPGDINGRARMSVHFQGMFGPNGPLPLHITEYARERLRNHGDATLVRFADIFHQRLLLLFYRVWSEGQPTVSFDRPTVREDHFASYVAALVGVGTPQLRGRDRVSDYTKLYYAGLLGAQSKNRDGLRAMIGGVLGMPTDIEEYVGEWVVIGDESRWRLGRTKQAGTLGLSTTLGGRAWLCQHKFRIRLGPLRSDQHRSLLPGGSAMPLLAALVRNYVGDELRWDVKVTLHKPELIRLGVAGQLGWTSFLARTGANEESDEVLLEPPVAAPVSTGQQI